MTCTKIELRLQDLGELPLKRMLLVPVCMYVCMYVCMCLSVYVFSTVNISILSKLYVCIYVCMVFTLHDMYAHMYVCAFKVCMAAKLPPTHLWMDFFWRPSQYARMGMRIPTHRLTQHTYIHTHDR